MVRKYFFRILFWLFFEINLTNDQKNSGRRPIVHQALRAHLALCLIISNIIYFYNMPLRSKRSTANATFPQIPSTISGLKLDLYPFY